MWAMVSAAPSAPTETPGSPPAAGAAPVGLARAAPWGQVVMRSSVTTALLELLVMPFLLVLCLFLEACLELGQVHTILSAQLGHDTAAPSCGVGGV